VRPVAGALVLAERLFALNRGLFASWEDFQLTLLELQRTGRVTLVDIDGQAVVKFRLEADTAAPTVSDLERGVLRLTVVEASLKQQVEQMEKDQEELRHCAKDLLKTNHRESAKHHFRKWKKGQATLEKRLKTLENVQGVLQTIEESKDNRKYLDALSRGTAAVKGAFGGVTVDTVEEVVADCQEALADQEDMQSIMSRPLAPADEGEAAELEDELNALLATAGVTPLRQTGAQTPQRGAAHTPQRGQTSPLKFKHLLGVEDLPSPPSESPGKASEDQARQAAAVLMEVDM